jgi:hypothetical protein
MNEQRRNFQRVPFDAETRVSQGDNSWAVELIDVSLNGILFRQPSDWSINPGQPLNIRMHLGENSHINMKAQLSHNTKTEVGCQCLHIDLDSITLLKRLIELNLGSNELLERELSALMSTHETNTD